MSSYLNIKLKHKDQEVKFAPCILFLSTTPARELANGINLQSSLKIDEHNNVSGEYLDLDLSLLHEIQEYYNDEIKSYEKSISDDKTEIEEKTNLLLNSKSEMVFNKIQEQIDDLKNHIRWAEEELESVQDYFRKFTYLEYLLDDNKDFSLIYYYG